MAQLSGVLSRGPAMPVISSQYEMWTDLHLFDPAGVEGYTISSRWLSGSVTSNIQTEPSHSAILRMLVAPCSSNRQANETYTQASATSTKLLHSKFWPHFCVNGFKEF